MKGRHGGRKRLLAGQVPTPTSSKIPLIHDMSQPLPPPHMQTLDTALGDGAHPDAASTVTTAPAVPEKCRDLVVVNQRGHNEYKSGAYLAEGTEYLKHAACRLRSLPSIPVGSKLVEAKAISLLYPTSGAGGPLETTKIPMGDLVVGVCSRKEERMLRDSVGGSFINEMVRPFYVGIPMAVYSALQRMIGAHCGSVDFWHVVRCSLHEKHVWTVADADKHLTGTVYVDGMRREVDMPTLIRQLNADVMCDAFVTISAFSDRSAGDGCKLGMTIKDLSVIDSWRWPRGAYLFATGDFVGRYRDSSPAVGRAAKLQVTEAEAGCGRVSRG